jgi:hypothetical protein
LAEAVKWNVSEPLPKQPGGSSRSSIPSVVSDHSVRTLPPSETL